jgi:ATP-dependent DNA helicase DinG
VSNPFADNVGQFFMADGGLAKAFEQFTPRSDQEQLAREIAKAIESNTRLVAEAGTGIGKTFAYLVPALLSGQKVIVSTGTKTLQDQLFTRDLPRLQQALKLQVHAALLKGRSNYVCHFHLRRHIQEGRFERAVDGAQLRKIEWFAARSASGDKADCHEVEEGADVWGLATSTRDNCLGQDCADWDRCFVVRARKEAQAADVVVINHHLYCADAALRDEGVAEILPSANVLIFDEAHQLPETCVQFFGTTISTRQLLDWCRDTFAAGLTEARDSLDWQDVLGPVERAVRDLRLAWPQGAPRLAGAALGEHPEFAIAVGHLLECWRIAGEALAPTAVRGPVLQRCVERGTELAEQIHAWSAALNMATTAAKQVPDNSDDSQDQEQAAWDDGDGPQVCWAQASHHHLSLHLTPLYIGRIFARRLQEAGQQAAIFLSATLAVDGKFDFFKRQLGLQDAFSQAWSSPFDYQNNALLYLPQQLGDPNHPDFTVRLLQDAWPLIEANKGRVFLLFTTLRAVKKASDWLRVKLANASFDAQLLVQGEMSKNLQLEKFRTAKAPILVGSASFWEGIDVVGAQLSLVVIDKIPFAPPDDPMLQARVDSLKKRGIDAFSTLQLPAAAISMKQGAGRLIRSESDRGVLMIGDSRLLQKGYGKRILRSLPPFKQSTSSKVALDFVSATVGLININDNSF